MPDPDAYCADPARLAALQRYAILDTPKEQDFDDISALAAQICDAPIALVTFVDCHRQWFKSKIGLELSETPLENSICKRAILEEKLLVVPDTLADPRFRTMPICINAPYMRSYAGAVIRAKDGHALGTVCVLDYEAREYSERQLEGLQILARQTLMMLELRRQAHQQGIILTQTEERLVGAMKASGGILWTANASGAMRGDQPGWSSFTGQQLCQYEDDGWLLAVHPDDQSATGAAWRSAVAARTRFDHHLRIRQADGTWQPCALAAVPVPEGAGVREWVGIIQPAGPTN